MLRHKVLASTRRQSACRLRCSDQSPRVNCRGLPALFLAQAGRPECLDQQLLVSETGEGVYSRSMQQMLHFLPVCLRVRLCFKHLVAGSRSIVIRLVWYAVGLATPHRQSRNVHSVMHSDH